MPEKPIPSPAPLRQGLGPERHPPGRELQAKLEPAPNLPRQPPPEDLFVAEQERGGR